jgi:hypothetical protein
MKNNFTSVINKDQFGKKFYNLFNFSSKLISKVSGFILYKFFSSKMQYNFIIYLYSDIIKSAEFIHCHRVFKNL